MADIPAAPQEGGPNQREMLFLTQSDGAGGLWATLLSAVTSELINGQRVGVMHVGVADEDNVAPATTVTTYNIELTLANTEYSQALPSNCKAISFRCRSSEDVRFAWVTGKVAAPTAPYQTLKANSEYWKDGVFMSGALYFASAVAGTVIEMEVWS